MIEGLPSEFIALPAPPGYDILSEGTPPLKNTLFGVETFITGLHCGKRVKEMPKFSAGEELFGQCPKERLFFIVTCHFCTD